jgi:tRNA dimethylallyltransferase
MGAMQTVFLVGPTAVGKSAIALELAQLVAAEMVSADSMQVYRGMDIGTAKPSADERALVPHHLIDVCEVSDAFDAKRFVDLATKAIAGIHGRNRVALVVGGTGLYVRALRRGLFEGPSRNDELRARLEKMNAAQLFEELQRVDPQTAERIDRHNPRRLVRALEVFHGTGKPIGELQSQWNPPHLDPLPQTTAASRGLGSPQMAGERRLPSPRSRGEGQSEGLAFCLTRERDDLQARIERRIDAQIAAGWVEEVQRLLARGLEKNATAMQAAGYRELVAHVRGDLSLAAAVALIKTRTRQLARRQLTWFRREPQLDWIEIGRDEPPSDAAKRVFGIIQQRENNSVS